MTVVALQEMLMEHWVAVTLVLCPVLVVLMALAALTCEACGAPFGIFRRRQRTIDLCLRCAVLHDIRSANDQKAASAQAKSAPAASADSSSVTDPANEARVYATQSPVELGSDGHPATH